MATLTDEQIIKKADAYEWDTFVMTVSGKARRVGLVFDRGYEDVDFYVIEADADVDEYGRRIAERWKDLKRLEEEDLTYLRAVELGEPRGQHILVRMASSGETEMFRCQKCSRLVPGKVDFSNVRASIPYQVISPSLAGSLSSRSGFSRKAYEEWSKFWQRCVETA